MLSPRPYQRHGIDAIREVWDCGFRNALVVYATGLGKALRVDQRVLTPSGWCPIGDLRPGDRVIGSDGTPTEVRSVHPQGQRQMYEVHTTDGAVVVCDAEHLWTVRTKYDKARGAAWRTFTLREIMERGIACNGGHRWELPMMCPPDLDATDLPIHPYLMGALLGDGHFSIPGRVSITAEPDFVETLRPFVPAPVLIRHREDAGKAVTCAFTGPNGRSPNPLLDAVRALGLEGTLSRDKWIPPAYMLGRAADRMALLRGLLDADGHACRDGHVEITLASHHLAEGVQRLVRSLGGTASLREKVTRWRYKGERRSGTAWRVSIALAECPFRWKADRWRPRTKYQPARRIRSVEPAGMAEAVCISIAADDGLFVTEGYVLTHNTVTFAHLIREVLAEHDAQAVALILAHRTELLEQARSKYLAVDPDELVGIFQGARKDTWARVICASVQSCYPDKTDAAGTVVRRGRSRQLPLSHIKLIVIDEAHHAVADSYMRLMEAIIEASPDVKILGVTATPYRNDNRALGDLWQCTLEDVRGGAPRAADATGVLAHRLGITEGMEMGYLVPLSDRTRRFELDVDLSGVKVSRSTGDFVEQSLATVIDTDAVRDLVVQKWIEMAGPGTPEAGERGRSTVAFCAGVEAATHLRDRFQAAGVAAEVLSGNTPKAERAEIGRRFEAGDITVLCNCQVLTEGWDAPRTSCVVLVRPTKSLSMFVQMVGRGLRLLGASLVESHRNGKSDCLLLDFGGASADGIVGDADLSRSAEAPGIDPSEDDKAIEALLDASPSDVEQLALEGVEREQRRATVRGISEYAVDLFAGGQIAWAILGGVKIAQVQHGLAVILWPHEDDRWSAVAIRDDAYRVLADRTDERDAMAAGSAFALLHGKKSLLKPGPWVTNKPATDRQKAALRGALAVNAQIDSARPPARRVNTSGLPHTPSGEIDYSRISISLANTWITYLYARIAFANRRARRVDQLFAPEERAAAAARLVGGSR